VAAQVLDRVEVGVVEDRGDGVEADADLAVAEDLLQPRQVVVAVDAVARSTAVARAQQSDLVVVVQRAHGDAGHPRHFSHRAIHRISPPPSTLGAPAA
jgi:hypothetical protein